MTAFLLVGACLFCAILIVIIIGTKQDQKTINIDAKQARQTILNKFVRQNDVGKSIDVVVSNLKKNDIVPEFHLR